MDYGIDGYPTEAEAEEIAKQVYDQICDRAGPGTPWHEVSPEERALIIADTKKGMLQILGGMKAAA
jgi:hypothetical protein